MTPEERIMNTSILTEKHLEEICVEYEKNFMNFFDEQARYFFNKYSFHEYYKDIKTFEKHVNEVILRCLMPYFCLYVPKDEFIANILKLYDLEREKGLEIIHKLIADLTQNEAKIKEINDT